MNLKTKKEIADMYEGGKKLANILQSIARIIKPGDTTAELDEMIEKMIIKLGGKPSFKGFYGYPFSSCISINEEIVHSLPGTRKIRNGDVVSVDVGLKYKNFHTDSALTIGVGKIDKIENKLITTTKESLENAIKHIKPGVKIGDIQSIIQKTIEKQGFWVVRNLAGHGIGRKLQEDPTIANIGKENTGFRLKEGMVFCLEPMASIGCSRIETKKDDWTIMTKDKSTAVHFEHTIAVTENGYLILTKP